jgi:pimeloyl-ACP methyl ester carboxylesterase
MVPAPDAVSTDRTSGTRPGSREQARARYPDTTGFVERDGVRVFYEVYGSGEPTLLLLPTWSIIHSRFWKLQIPYLARRFRVITFDGRGNGRSDRPQAAEAYTEVEFAADALAVLDATSTDHAVLVALSMGAQRGLLVASEHPERVAGAVFIGPSLALDPVPTGRGRPDEFMERQDSDTGWAKYNGPYWRRDYQGFLEFFFGQCFTEPHSTKPIEDCVGWGLETDPDTLILTHLAAGIGDRDETLARAVRVRCPVLVIHGRDDAITPHRHGEELAEVTRGRLVTIEGGGHIPNARDPVKINLAIRDFVESIPR